MHYGGPGAPGQGKTMHNGEFPAPGEDGRGKMVGFPAPGELGQGKMGTPARGKPSTMVGFRLPARFPAPGQGKTKLFMGASGNLFRSSLIPKHPPSRTRPTFLGWMPGLRPPERRESSFMLGFRVKKC